MNAGSLRHRCWIKEKTISPDGDGSTTDTWGTVTVCWGSLQPLRGREYMASGLENSEVSEKFVMRWVSGISPAMQLYYDSSIYEIVSVIDPDHRRKELELMVKVLVVS